MPTDWEAHYEQSDTPWDKGAPSPALLDFLAGEPVTGRVLVPGCGLGYDVRALAATAGEVVGLDIAPSAVAAAQRFPVVGPERYAVADLFALPESWRGTFDWVWEHTCFCAIDPAQRPQYVSAVAAALRPAGKLLAVFYLDPGLADPNDGPPFGVSREELAAFFSPHFTIVREWLPTRTYPGREGREWMQVLERMA